MNIDDDIYVPRLLAEGHLPEGRTLRDYFIAHAPAEPQGWFQPRMPEEPLKKFGGDNGVEYSTFREAKEAGSSSFTQLNVEETENWKREFDKQRYVQWPLAWADAILEARRAATAGKKTPT